MTSDELYLAISELINNNSKELEYRMDTMEERLSNRIDNLDAKIDGVEANLHAEIVRVEKTLGDQIRNIYLCLENVIEPRLQNIEMCYVTTYERYKMNNEKFECMQLDIDVLRSVVRKHDEILCTS